MEMSAATANNYDAMASEIDTRRKAVSKAQSVAVELEKRREPNPIPTASSKLAKYRASSTALNSYNRSTELFLDPSTQATRLQRPQHYRSALPGNNGGESGHDMGESEDETFVRLNKALRIKNAKIEEQAAEVTRYKGLLDDVHRDLADISKENAITAQKINELLHDLEMEKQAHKDARLSLEEKSREVEQHAFRLAEQEQISTAKHQENVQLAERIQEMTRLADIQHQQLQQALAEASTADGAEVATANGGGEGPAQKELEKLKQLVEMKTHQLAKVKEREESMRTELQVYKGQARSGRFKSLLLNLWWLLRSVGFFGFLLFVYVAVSEDAFRSRGVDVYRVAH